MFYRLVTDYFTLPVRLSAWIGDSVLRIAKHHTVVVIVQNGCGVGYPVLDLCHPLRHIVRIRSLPSHIVKTSVVEL